MSKAFVKEDSEQENIFEFDIQTDEDDFLELTEGEDTPVGGAKNYITRSGYQKLQAEIHQLADVERPKVVLASVAQSDVGPSYDDAEMKVAQRRLREIDRELRILHRRFDAAEVVDPEMQSADHVLFGATVTVFDEDEQTRVYRIVGAHETDAKAGKISWRSPIGKALLQAKIGDFVTLNLPHGEEDLEIRQIEYLPL